MTVTGFYRLSRMGVFVRRDKQILNIPATHPFQVEPHHAETAEGNCKLY